MRLSEEVIRYMTIKQEVKVVVEEEAADEVPAAAEA
jgi:ribosomal protein S6